jgi:hypothetical protein
MIHLFCAFESSADLPYDNLKPSKAVFELKKAEQKEHLALDASPSPLTGINTQLKN